MNKKILIIFASIALITIMILFSTNFVNIQRYRLFKMNKDICKVYYKDCICIGSLMIMETMPPQYKCGGLNFCRNINAIECIELN